MAIDPLESTQSSDAGRARPETEPAAGSRIGRFRVISTLGAGGMGVVYLAQDDDLQRRVAIKLVRGAAADDPAARERLVREAQALARFSHPGIVTIYEVGRHGDQVFLAMEHVEGPTLRAWLRDRERPRVEILEMFVAIGRALAAAHAAGITHRDFKPDNVLIGRDGRPRVLDFGLARAIDDPLASTASPTSSGDVDLTRTGALLGTPAYMAPEQLEAKPADARSDQFAFCVALYEALYGRRPFRGDTLAQLTESVLHGPAPSAPDGPPGLDRGLARDPAARFPDLPALLRAIAPAPRRSRLPWIAAAIALVAAAVLGWLLLRPKAAARTCPLGTSRLAGVWDRETRAAIEARFAANPRPDVAGTWTAVARILDDYTARWIAQWDAACASKDRTADPLLDAQRRTCLEDALLEITALGRGLQRDDLGNFSLSFEGTYSIKSLADCDDVEVLRRQAPAPPPEVRAEYDAAMLDLFEARQEGRLAINAGLVEHMPTSLAHLDEVAARFLALDQPRGAAVALRWKGSYLAYPDPAAARTTLDRARELAIAGHDETLVADTLTVLAEIEGNTSADQAQVATAIERAAEALARAGSPRSVANQLLGVRIRIAQRFGDHAGALAFARAAIDATVAIGQEGSAIGSYFAMSAALRALDRPDEAIAEARIAIASKRRQVGPAHHMYARTLNLFATELAGVGSIDEALATLREARSIDALLVGESSPDVEDRSWQEFEIASHLDRDDEARAALERAITARRARTGSGLTYEEWVGRLAELRDRGTARARALLYADGVAPSATARDRVLVADERALDAFVIGDAAAIRTHARAALAEPAGDLGEYFLAAPWFLAIAERIEGDAAAASRQLAAVPRELPDAGLYRFITGLTLAVLQRWTDAIVELEAARAAPELAGNRLLLAYQGRALVETGAHARALEPLEAAVQLVTACCPGDTLERPLAELALAEALWETGGDHDRARKLAASARDGFARLGPGRFPDRDAAASWLEAHP